MTLYYRLDEADKYERMLLPIIFFSYSGIYKAEGDGYYE